VPEAGPACLDRIQGDLKYDSVQQATVVAAVGYFRKEVEHPHKDSLRSIFGILGMTKDSVTELENAVLRSPEDAQDRICGRILFVGVELFSFVHAT
jgi:hypothetical protein